MLRFTCAILFLLLPGVAFTAAAGSTAGLADPVIIPGSQLDILRGKATASLRMFALRNGSLVAIPFQIDQRDSRNNWVWDAVSRRNQINRYEYDNLGIAGPDWERRRAGRTHDDQDPQGEALLDANDVVVFMAADLGSRASATEPGFVGASAVEEIRLADRDGTSPGWAYLAYYAAAPPPLSPERYMHYLPEQLKIISPVYQATFSQQHVSMLEQLTIGDVGLLDRTKLRGEVRAGRSPVSWDFHFTEENITGHVEGYIDGPVRIVRRTVAALRLGELVSVSELRSDQFFYPYHSEVPVSLSLGVLTEKASLLLAADYHGAPFRQAFASGRRVAIGLREARSGGNLLKPREGLSWLALDGERASIVSVLTVPEEIRDYTKLSVRLTQDRTASDPPEAYPGADPEAGYLIETSPGFPPGTHRLVGTYLYLPRPFARGDAAQAIRLAGSRLGVKVSTFTRAGDGQTGLAGAAQQLRRGETGPMGETVSRD